MERRREKSCLYEKEGNNRRKRKGCEVNGGMQKEQLSVGVMYISCRGWKSYQNVYVNSHSHRLKGSN